MITLLIALLHKLSKVGVDSGLLPFPACLERTYGIGIKPDGYVGFMGR